MKKLWLFLAVCAGLVWAADEIDVTTRLECENGYLKVGRSPDVIRVTQTTQGAHAGIQIIGTNWEQVTFGDVVTEGWAYFRNMDEDTENRVELAVRDVNTNYLQFALLGAGETASFRLWTNITLYAQASSTNEVKLDKLILED